MQAHGLTADNAHGSASPPGGAAGGHGHGHDAHAHGPELLHHFDTPKQQFVSSKLGMWLFLVTEVLFFGGLFCFYAVYRYTHPEIFDIAHKYLDKVMGAINTCVLIFSSLTMAWAVRCAQLGNKRGLIVSLVVTMACAWGFMVVKTFEYHHKYMIGTLPASAFHPTELPPDHDTPAAHHAADLSAAEAHSAAAHHADMLVNISLFGIRFVQNAELLKFCLALLFTVVIGHAIVIIWGRGWKDRFNALSAGQQGGVVVGALIALFIVGKGLHGTMTDPSDHKPAAGSAAHADAAAHKDVPAGTAVTGSHPKPAVEMPDNTRNVGVFFSIYFCMTGLHGIHVLVGIGLLGWLTQRAMYNEFSGKYFTPVDLIGLYWHIVDLIWIYLFPLLYLIK